MPFTTPDYQAIRDAILRDIVNQLPAAAVGADSDYAIRANAVGAAIEGNYQHQLWIARQIFPDTADTDYLEHHCSLRNLSRKAATLASGTITFSGAAGSGLPIGTEAKTANGVAYLTTDVGTLDGFGTATIAAQSAVAGIVGNQANGTTLTLTAAPAGVLSLALIDSMTSGTDAETDAALLARLLFTLRNPPHGGAAHDYYTWAMSVNGVSAAYPIANRRGLGTVDVVILSEGSIPAPGLVSSVQTYLDSVRPITADVVALGPTAVLVTVAATLTLAANFDPATVEAALDAALATYFSALAPGETAYLHRISAVISDTDGVVDFVLTSPVANVPALLDSTHTELAMLDSTLWS